MPLNYIIELIICDLYLDPLKIPNNQLIGDQQVYQSKEKATE